MGIKDNAEAHFQKIVGDKLNSVDVPEWGGKVYYRGGTTGITQEKVMGLINDNKLMEANFVSLIHRAKDKEGSPIWRPIDIKNMMRTIDYNVVLRVNKEITDATEVSEDDAKK